MEKLYEWVDQFKLSRPKRQIARDFSDAGVKPRTMSQITVVWLADAFVASVAGRDHCAIVSIVGGIAQLPVNAAAPAETNQLGHIASYGDETSTASRFDGHF